MIIISVFITLTLLTIFPSGGSGWSLLECLLILDPVMRIQVLRVDEFRDHFEIAFEDEHCPGILVTSTIISRTKHSNQLSS